MPKMDEPITDPEWVTAKHLKITKYNRTASSFKGVLSFLRDLPDNTIVSITYSPLFSRMISFIASICFSFHTRNFTNVIDVRPPNNRMDLHFSGIQKTNGCE